ncbi:MAG TPA: hypothetical protein VF529_17600 [Solirubrobacteraceae bacterium]
MTARLLVLLATAVVAVASLSVGREPSGPLLRATAGGALQLESSRDGEAVLTASRLRPGDSVSGTLTLTNRAGGPQRLTLSVSDLVDTPGAGGGVLSEWADLVVERDAAEVVYTGKLAGLSELELGDLAAGSTTPFRFVVTLPEQGPAVDDAYAGSSVSVAWSWRGDTDVAPVDDDSSRETPPPGDVVPPEPSDVAPSGRDSEPVAREPSPDEIEGALPAGASPVRLWLGGPSAQRLSGGLGLSAVCRPSCTVRAAAKVRVGGRWRALGRRALGTLAAGSQPSVLRFRLSALQQRSLRATLRRHGALRVRVTITAVTPGHRSVTKVRTLRLLP